MYFQYGNYRHDSGECRVSNPNPVRAYSAEGVLQQVKTRLLIEGRKHAANPSALTDAMNAMAAAYAIDGMDACLYEDSGVQTALKILSSQTTYGVKVVQPPAIVGDTRGHYVNYVDYSIILEAELASATSSYFDYSENVDYTPALTLGVDREFVIQRPIVGYLQRQASDLLTYTCRQSGQVSSKLLWLPPNPPAHPYAVHPDMSRTRYSTLHTNRGGTSYVTSWEYFMESATPLTGYPSVRYT